MDIFSSREIASFIWIVAVLLFTLKSDDVGKSILRLIKSLFGTSILFLFDALAVYIMAVCYVLSKHMTWGLDQLKTAIFWYLFVGCALLFNAVNPEKKYAPLKSWFKSTFTFLILLEFLISKYTFPLYGELIFVPLISLVAMISVVAEFDKKHEPVQKLMSGLLAIIGLTLAGHAILKFVQDDTIWSNTQILQDFSLPIILSLVTIPFFYGLHVYSSYQSAFLHLRWGIPDETLRKKSKWKAIKLFGMKVRSLERWTRLTQGDRPETMAQVISSIEEAKRVKRLEKNPPPVDPKLGWSPYVAQKFLASLGVKMFDYREYDGRWHSDSHTIKTKVGYSPNHMIYIIEGSEIVADTLRLKLTMNNLSEREQDLELFTNYACLLASAAEPDLSLEAIIEDLISQTNATINIGSVNLTVEKEVIEAPNLEIEEYGFRIRKT